MLLGSAQALLADLEEKAAVPEDMVLRAENALPENRLPLETLNFLAILLVP